MGFFDKIKNAVKAVTGGAAKVTMEYTPMTAMPGDTIRVKISATSTGGEVKSKGIFVDICGTEEIVLKEGKAMGVDKDLTVSKCTLEQAFQIAPEFVLGANETKLFEGAFQVPGNAAPSYQGVFVSHKWTIQGRVEATGNDPDTGWQPLGVGAKA